MTALHVLSLLLLFSFAILSTVSWLCPAQESALFFFFVPATEWSVHSGLSGHSRQAGDRC